MANRQTMRSVQTSVEKRPRSALHFMRAFPAAHESRKALAYHPDPPLLETIDILEIGPGRGDFLFAMAEAHPKRRFAAIELGKKRYFKLIRRVDQRALTNVQLILGDARFAVPRCIRSDSLAAIYVLFPDPWPKRRHAFHRLLGPEFLALLADRLRPGGTLLIRTDVDAYAAEIAAYGAEVKSLTVSSLENCTRITEPPEVQTLYEQRRRAAGATIHTLCWHRNDVTPAASAAGTSVVGKEADD